MMGVSRKVLLWAVLIIAIAIITFSVTSYAASDNSCDFRSYTRALKSCDKYGNCILQDFLVECCGSYISSIVPLGNFIPVPTDHAESILGWCE